MALVSQLDQASWLIGTWENKTSRGSMYETWRRVDEKALAGRSYMLREKDTIVFENVQLVQEAAGVVYIPTVEGQNNGQPVRFPLTKLTATELVFENPEHDFPQVITYTKIHEDSLVASIAGTKNGKQRKQLFPMHRLK